MSVAEKAGRSPAGSARPSSVIVQALLLALVIRTLLFQPFSIPSGSMMPTLLDRRLPVRHQVGLRLFAIFVAVGTVPFSGRMWSAEPERGDVVVFKFPPNPALDYIKRVIGLPGDRSR
jgi:signal peptidase I